MTELLLGPSSEAGRGPVSRRRGGGAGDDMASRGLKPAAVYSQNACRAGVHVRPGERFTLMLPADVSHGYTWDTPVVLNDDRSTVAIVRFQGMDPQTVNAGAGVRGGRHGDIFNSICGGAAGQLRHHPGAETPLGHQRGQGGGVRRARVGARGGARPVLCGRGARVHGRVPTEAGDVGAVQRAEEYITRAMATAACAARVAQAPAVVVLGSEGDPRRGHVNHGV